MNKNENEYNEFMLKWLDKSREIQKDFEKLSRENQERVKQDISNSVIISLLNNTKY